jgi:hypothetical protein
MMMSEEVSQRVAATITVHLDNAANIIEVRELLSTLGFNYEIEIHDLTVDQAKRVFGDTVNMKFRRPLGFS